MFVTKRKEAKNWLKWTGCIILTVCIIAAIVTIVCIQMGVNNWLSPKVKPDSKNDQSSEAILASEMAHSPETPFVKGANERQNSFMDAPHFDAQTVSDQDESIREVSNSDPLKIREGRVDQNGNYYVKTYNGQEFPLPTSGFSPIEMLMLTTYFKKGKCDVYEYGKSADDQWKEFDDWFNVIHRHYNLGTYNEDEIIQIRAPKLEIKQFPTVDDHDRRLKFCYEYTMTIPYPLTQTEEALALDNNALGRYDEGAAFKKQFFLYLWLKHSKQILDATNPQAAPRKECADERFKEDEFTFESTIEFKEKELNGEFDLKGLLWDDAEEGQKLKIFSICGRKEHAVTWEAYQKTQHPYLRKCSACMGTEPRKKWKLHVLQN